MPARASRATLATVAESAGVSVATVSKVLNGRSDVAPTTRARVQALLEQHDYVAAAPRHPRAAADRTVQMEFDDHLNAYAAEIIQGAIEAGADLGVSVVVSLRPGGRKAPRPRGATWARDLAALGRQAFIAVTSDLTTAHLTALSRARLPLVVIDPMNLPRARVTSIGSTNFAGGLTATQHLLDLGHRRVAYLGGRAGAACDQARMHGYRAAMETAGIPVPPDYIQPGNFLYPDGMAAAAALLDLRCRPTALFAANDVSAVAAIEAARTRGLRVPQDLSVVGFDDTQVARMSSPPLTTIRQPLREMGGVALRTALRLAAGERIDSNHVELATELVVRASTAAPPN
jgi:LacI family transcriptional regulator, galactose operon repressor